MVSVVAFVKISESTLQGAYHARPGIRCVERTPIFQAEPAGPGSDTPDTNFAAHACSHSESVALSARVKVATHWSVERHMPVCQWPKMGANRPPFEGGSRTVWVVPSLKLPVLPQTHVALDFGGR